MLKLLENLDSHIFEGLAIISNDSNPCTKCLDPTATVHFHGSDLGKCALRVFYKLKSKNTNNKDLDNLTKAQFLDGHLSEKLLVEGLKAYIRSNNLPIIVDHNPEKSKIFTVVLNNKENRDIEIVGHADVLLHNIETGERVIVEMKAVKNYSYKFKFLTGDIGEDYLLQVQAYLNIFDVDVACIIAKNRETTELSKPIIIKKDISLFQERLYSLAKIQSCYLSDSQVKPPKAYESKNNFECKYCDYTKKCWGLNV